MENIEIAKIITSQIGSKALYMIGAINLMATDRGVQFKIMRNERKVTHISIKLNDLDLYDLEFINLNKKTYDIKKISLVNNIYADSLKNIITSETGLNTSLY